MIFCFLVLCQNVTFSADSTHSYHSLFETGNLIGTWKMESSGKTLIETWNNLSNETLEGKSILLNPNKLSFDTISVESMRLVEMENEVFFIIKPDENPFPTPYKLIATSNNTLIFENKNYYFPKKIIYRFKDRDNIDIEMNNGSKQIYLYYKRVK